MFNLGIFRKTFEDSLLTLVLTAVGLIAFVIVFVWAMLNMGQELMEFVSRVPFIARVFEMSLGVSIAGDVSPQVLFAICFTHGIVLALAWTAIISTATRVTAGEVERGTADLLLTLPVSRPEIHFTSSLVWLTIAAVLSLCPIAGIAIAVKIFEVEQAIVLMDFVRPAINFLCLNLAVGGIASLAGSILNRRGLAVGVTVGLLLLSMVLNFLEPFLTSLKPISFLSLLAYFRPVDIVRTGELPLVHCATLLAIGLVSWMGGMVVFSRKDIPTA